MCMTIYKHIHLGCSIKKHFKLVVLALAVLRICAPHGSEPACSNQKKSQTNNWKLIFTHLLPQWNAKIVHTSIC